MNDDTVKCYRTATFGPYGWLIPQSAQSYPDGVDAYKWFARFLLEGQVHPFFVKYANKLVSPASVLVKSWAKLQPRTTSMVNALAASDIRRRKSLELKWKASPDFLLNETLEWVAEELHYEVRKNWPGNAARK